MEAFSTHGNGTMTIIKEKSPKSFEVEQNLQTMNGARTITFDRARLSSTILLNFSGQFVKSNQDRI
jgi:hypothetical protein